MSEPRKEYQYETFTILSSLSPAPAGEAFVVEALFHGYENREPFTVVAHQVVAYLFRSTRTYAREMYCGVPIRINSEQQAIDCKFHLADSDECVSPVCLYHLADEHADAEVRILDSAAIHEMGIVYLANKANLKKVKATAMRTVKRAYPDDQSTNEETT